MWGTPPVETQIWESRGSVGGQLSTVWEEHLSREGRQAGDWGQSRVKKLYNGYRYVDVPIPDSASRERFIGQIDKADTRSPDSRPVFTREQTRLPAPRYGVRFEDNLDPSLRKHWIAGTTVSVVDTVTSEVISQRSFWAWDRGFGATGQVVPWRTNTNRCPAIDNPMSLIHATLKAKQGN